MFKVISVVGARPNFMKMAPIHKELLKHKKNVKHKIIHTGQHYDRKMSDVFFKDLELPKPEIYLGAGSASHTLQTADIMIRMERVLTKEKPDLVLVYGDVNSTIAAGLVCAKILINGQPIPLAHIESGLRSFDRTMPEEINRILTDNIAEHLFVTEKSGVRNLVNSGFDRKKIYFVGNTMIDSLKYYLKKIKNAELKYALSHGQYALITLHRPVNVDNKESLINVFKIFRDVLKTCPDIKLVFPVHPRTRKMIDRFKILKNLSDINNLMLVDPLGYLDFINLMRSAKFILTDSGGIQEETTYLKIPCITLRENTERPVTISEGTNVLTGLNRKEIIKYIKQIESGKFKKGKIPEFWDGKSSERIVRHIMRILNS